MQLNNKKNLASKVLGVGKNRIFFSKNHISEIKEAITRQDIVDLHKSGAIQIKPIKGRKKIVRRKHRRRTGKVKAKVNKSKQDYVKSTRKLRKFAKHLLRNKDLDKDKHIVVRKMIKAKSFKSKRHLKESLKELS